MATPFVVAAGRFVGFVVPFRPDALAALVVMFFGFAVERGTFHLGRLVSRFEF